MKNSPNIRIALYLPSLRGGGAERVMVTLAGGFLECGYQVDLVLAKAEGSYLDDVPAQVRVVDLNSSRVSRSLPGLVRYLRRARPTVMLSAMGHANAIAVVARVIAKVPVRIILSEHANFSASSKGVKAWRRRLMQWFMRWTYPRADGIVAVSIGVADDLATSLELPRGRVTAIYNPITTPELQEQARKPCEHPWLQPGQPPVLLAVGRLTVQKDFVTLIKAFAHFSQRHSARLIILGEGKLRHELEAFVQTCGLNGIVALPGFVDNPFAYMRRASLFVLSSQVEGLPSVLIQAMACGTPVVSTDCPSGPAEILENGKWGRLVPVGDVAALAEAMVATLEDIEPPDVAARAAIFNLDNAVNDYLAIMLPDQYKEKMHEH